MAFARKARADRGGGPVNFSSPALGVFNEGQSMYISKRHIEAANPTELEEMEAQMKEVSQIIEAEMQKRRGDDTIAKPASSIHDPATETPGAQAQQQIEHIKVEEAPELGNAHDDPTILEAEHIDDNVSAAETAQAAKTTEPVKTVDHETTPPAIAEAASQPPADATIEMTDIANQSAVPTVDKEGIKTGTENNATVIGVLEELVDQDVNAALTPVSDAVKEPNELPSIKPIQNGVETPETNIPDQTMSPVEAGMDLD